MLMKKIYTLGVAAAIFILIGAGCSKDVKPPKEDETPTEAEIQEVATSTEESPQASTSTEEHPEQPGTVHIDLRKESVAPKIIAKATDRTDSYGCPYEE